MSDQMSEGETPAAPPIAVAGPFARSFADFERALLVHIDEEQRRASPDNALIAVLCDAVRLTREQVAPLIRETPAAPPDPWTHFRLQHMTYCDTRQGSPVCTCGLENCVESARRAVEKRHATELAALQQQIAAVTKEMDQVTAGRFIADAPPAFRDCIERWSAHLKGSRP